MSVRVKPSNMAGLRVGREESAGCGRGGARIGSALHHTGVKSVRYLSTRDARPEPATCSFEEILLAGLAEDGGLYVPERVPAVGALGAQPYGELAARVVGLFAGDDFPPAQLRALTDEAYATFHHPAVAPLTQLDERTWLMELFHGPTLAFKDLALQLVGRMIDAALARRGEHVT